MTTPSRPHWMDIDHWGAWKNPATNEWDCYVPGEQLPAATCDLGHQAHHWIERRMKEAADKQAAKWAEWSVTLRQDWDWTVRWRP